MVVCVTGWVNEGVIKLSKFDLIKVLVCYMYLKSILLKCWPLCSIDGFDAFFRMLVNHYTLQPSLTANNNYINHTNYNNTVKQEL